MIVLLQLLLAHVLTDFIFQTKKWIAQKRRKKVRSLFLYIHSALAGILSYILLMEWKYWYIGLFIAVSHFFIDLWKLKKEQDNLKYFLLDQLFHLIAIVLAWLFIIKGYDEIFPLIKTTIASTEVLAITVGYILVVFPVGFLIGRATERWRKEIEETGGEESSLAKAGRYIGIFERIMVLTFIISNNISAIGFLIGAKSILRFSDKGETGARKQTEYVLIGTLMSFAITIVIGMLVRVLAFEQHYIAL